MFLFKVGRGTLTVERLCWPPEIFTPGRAERTAGPAIAQIYLKKKKKENSFSLLLLLFCRSAKEMMGKRNKF